MAPKKVKEVPPAVVSSDEEEEEEQVENDAVEQKPNDVDQEEEEDEDEDEEEEADEDGEEETEGSSDSEGHAPPASVKPIVVSDSPAAMPKKSAPATMPKKSAPAVMPKKSASPASTSPKATSRVSKPIVSDSPAAMPKKSAAPAPTPPRPTSSVSKPIADSPAAKPTSSVSKRAAEKPSLGESSIDVYAAQCEKCKEWRVIQSEDEYEEIRSKISEKPFFCDTKSGVSCDDPADIEYNNTRTWLSDKPGMKKTPEGFKRHLVVRKDYSRLDTYYITPEGNKVRSQNHIAQLLKDKPKYIGLSASDFDYYCPKVMQDTVPMGFGKKATGSSNKKLKTSKDEEDEF